MNANSPTTPVQKIVVVDDMPANLTLLEQTLKARGYDVRLIRNPLFALQAIPVAQPDLILLDIFMPELDGYQVCQKLKADDRTRDIPIIFLSALSSTEEKVKAFDVGGVDYISKPFEIVEVLARVETHLRLQQQQVRLKQEIQERQRAEMESSLLLMATQAIDRAPDVPRAIAALLTLIGKALKCELAEAWQQTKPKQPLERIAKFCSVSQPDSLSPLPEPQLSNEASFFSQLLASGQLEWLEDVSNYPEFSQSQPSVREVLGVPIFSEEEGVAILVFYHYQPQSDKIRLIDAIATIARQLSLLIERKHAEAAQRRAEQKYQNIVENSLEGIFQASVDRHYLSVNPALARIYGYNSPEHLMAKITDIAEQVYVNPQSYYRFITKMKQQGGVSGFEALVYHRNGRQIWVSKTGRAVRDGAGNILYYEGTVADISDRKQIEADLQAEKDKTEGLLLNIFPRSIAQRLQAGESPIADSFEDVSILFADLVGFTEFAAQKTPVELVEILSEIFSEFDRSSQYFGLEKIKTIGDNYMVVGGLPNPHLNHATAIAQMALAMQNIIADYNREARQNFQLRVGIHLGSVVAGVMGQSKTNYDIWGDAVNIASRMESTGKAGRIQVSASVYERLKDRFDFEERGEVDVRGKGKMLTYWLIG